MIWTPLCSAWDKDGRRQGEKISDLGKKDWHFFFLWLSRSCLVFQPQLNTIMGIRGWGEKIVVVGLKGCYPYTTFYSMGLWGPLHTVAIWTFTFHEKSGWVLLIWKANFKPTYRPNSSTFWSGNSNLLYSFFFYYLQNLLNPVIFTHCCCYPIWCKNCNSNMSTL